MFHFPGLLPTYRGSPAYSQQVPPSDIHGSSGCWDLTVAFRTQLRPLLSGYPRHPSYAFKQTLSSSIYVIMLSIYPPISSHNTSCLEVFTILTFLFPISRLFYTFFIFSSIIIFPTCHLLFQLTPFSLFKLFLVAVLYYFFNLNFKKIFSKISHHKHL